MSAPKKLLKQRAKEASVATSASLEPKQSTHKGFVPLVCASSHGKLLSATAMKHHSKGNKAPYKDLANVLPSPGYKAPTRIQDMNFAEKVHHMLSDPECLHFIAWMPHGRAFKVVVPELFEIHVCPRYFGHKRYALFRSDLEEHGFRYIRSGRDRNCKPKLLATAKDTKQSLSPCLVGLTIFVIVITSFLFQATITSACSSIASISVNLFYPAEGKKQNGVAPLLLPWRLARQTIFLCLQHQTGTSQDSSKPPLVHHWTLPTWLFSRQSLSLAVESIIIPPVRRVIIRDCIRGRSFP